MLATSVQPLLSKLLTCSACSCIVYCRGTFSTIVSVGEPGKRSPSWRPVHSGAGRIKNLCRSAALNHPEPRVELQLLQWQRGRSFAHGITIRKCSPDILPGHLKRRQLKVMLLVGISKSLGKIWGRALIATVSNKFSLRGERSEPGELFLPCGFSCVSGPDVAKFETTSAMGSKP